MIFESLTERIIACSIEVHKELGPGLLESIYESALGIEFFRHGMRYQRQKSLPVGYKGESIGGFRVYLLVEDTVVIELKSTERHDTLFEAQLLSYMKLGGYNLGLLINFNSVLLTKGIKRLVM